MKPCSVTHCPYCEKNINYQITDEGSCPKCNADLSHVSTEFNDPDEKE